MILTGVLVIIIRPFDMTWFDGLWIVFIGWFLSSSASGSYRQIIKQERTKPSNDIELPSDDYTVLPREGEEKD